MALSLTNMSLEERFSALDDEKAQFVSKVYSGLTASLRFSTARITSTGEALPRR